MTFGAREEAEFTGKLLVQERLVACVNILQGMLSTYWWDGQIQTAQEVVLIAKTKTLLVDRVSSRVQELHSYDVPCVVACPIQGGNPDFLSWIGNETV